MSLPAMPRHSQDLPDPIRRSVIRIGFECQEEKYQGKENHGENDHCQSLSFRLWQRPQESDGENFQRAQQNHERCENDPLLDWIGHHVQDGVDRHNPFLAEDGCHVGKPECRPARLQVPSSARHLGV